MLSIPLGILNAIMVNVGTILVLKIIPLVKFKRRHIAQYVTVFIIFVFSYFSLGILIMKRYFDRGHTYIPPDFTRLWIVFYGNTLTTQMIMSNLLQYIAPSLKILFRRGCCCCKRKNYKINKNSNPLFPIERRYGNLITTLFVCFTYGLALPSLFITSLFVFLIQFILDKILITYFWKEQVIHNDLLNRFTLRIIKYGICIFLYFGGVALY